MTLPSIAQIDIAEKRVFIRVDFDFPTIGDTSAENNRKIINALPTIRYALAQNAKVVIASSFGNAKGRYNKKYSLEAVGSILSQSLGTEIYFPDNSIGEAVKKIGTDMQPGQVMLLENLEFQKGEIENSSDYARKLSECADIYVNEAFSLCDHNYASIVSICDYFENLCIGFQFENEIKNLESIKNPQRPFTAILGGSNVLEKLELAEYMLDQVDTVILGGVFANTFLNVLGGETGRSQIEKDAIYRIKRFISSAETRNINLVLPQDLLAIKGDLNNYESSFIISGGRLPKDMKVVDIGPDAQSDFQSRIEKAKTVLWSGPLGICEHDEFKKGTEFMARALAESDIFSVIIGQDTIDTALDAVGQEGRSFISYGGQCSVDYLLGKELLGIEAIKGRL
ncbi:MAG: phosphoglycerate kinase [Thermodesulfobacteriota bacterium]